MSMNPDLHAPQLVSVVRSLERLYPLQFAETWDHPGLVVGDPQDRVSTVAFAVDPTMHVVDKAIAAGADMLICHHPLFFRSVHEVSAMSVHGAIVSKLYRNHCALWVGHTNADVAYRGVAQAAADAFGLNDQEPLCNQETYDGHHIGLGRVGELAEPMTLREFAQRVAKVLPQTPYGVQVGGDLDALIRRVAVLPGSGDSNLDEVHASGADVYVTSDLRHHPATDALEQARYEAVLPHGDESHGIYQGMRQPRPALINTPHSAIESLWFRYALEDVSAAIRQDTGFMPHTLHIDAVTDPWQLVLPGTVE